MTVIHSPLFRQQPWKRVPKQQQQTTSDIFRVCFPKTMTELFRWVFIMSKHQVDIVLQSVVSFPLQERQLLFFLLILNPCTLFPLNANGYPSWRTTSPLWASHHGNYERFFNGKSKDPIKKHPFLFSSFQWEFFFLPKPHRADRCTHTAMTPFTVGPLCPTVFKSKSLWLNGHIPDRTPLQWGRSVLKYTEDI